MTKGMFVLFGPPGLGKSTVAAETFQDSVYLSSSPNVLQFYKQMAAARGLPLPRKEVVIDTYSVGGVINTNAAGLPVPVHTKSTLESLLDQIFNRVMPEAAAKKPLTYRNLIIDEGGTFWTRVLDEIMPATLTKSGAIDTRAAYGAMGKWSNWIVNFKLRPLLSAGLNVCIVAHAQEPDAKEDKKGGPKFPSATIMHQVCADADGVLFRVVEDAPVDINNPGEKKPPTYMWRVHAAQNWLSKLRGIPTSDFETVKALELKQILERAGFEP